MHRPVIRPATLADLTEFYGEPPAATLRAIVGVVDGKPLGLGGIVYAGPHRVVFCDLKPEAKAYRLSIHRIALQVLDMARSLGIREMAAVQDPNEPTAPRWLARLGFEHVGESEHGRVYRWQS